MTLIRTPLPLPLTLAAVLGLAACSPPTDTPAPPPAAAPAPPAATPPATGATSEVVLNALTPEDIQQAALPGELGCSFAGPNGSALLVAMGVVASTQDAVGVVKAQGAVQRVTAPGGFDAMLKGGTFTGSGATVRIALTGPASGGGESPPRPATLTYDQAEGAQQVIAGSWTCGP